MAISKTSKTGKGLSLASWEVEELLDEGLIGDPWKMTDEEHKRLWKRHVKELLTVYLGDSRNYATRPVGWWDHINKEQKKLIGYGSYWDDKRVFKIYRVVENDAQFFKRTEQSWPCEAGVLEQRCALESETQARLLAAHEAHLKSVPRSEVEQAEKRAGLTSARLKVVVG